MTLRPPYCRLHVSPTAGVDTGAHTFCMVHKLTSVRDLYVECHTRHIAQGDKLSWAHGSDIAIGDVEAVLLERS